MKCRTCLNVVDLSSGIHLRKKLCLGKTVQEIICFFIPEMVKSKLVDDYICNECVNSIQLFIKFIEKIISVENYLRDTNVNQIQLQIQNISDTFLDEPSGSTVNKSINKQTKPLVVVQQPPAIEPTTFTKPLRTYPGKNEATNVTNRQCKTHPAITNIQNRIEETKKSTEKCQEVINYANKFLKPTIQKPNSSFSNISQLVSIIPEDGAVETQLKANLEPVPGDLETVDLDVIADFLDIKEDDSVLHEEPVNQELITDDLCLDEMLSLIKTYNPSPLSLDVNLSHTRVIGLPKTNVGTADLLKKLSKSNVTLMKQDSLKDTESKRVLLLGTAFFHCPECKIPFSAFQPMKNHFTATHPTIACLPTIQNKFSDVVTYSKLVEGLKEVCPVCDRRFMTPRMLDNHVRYVHKDYCLYNCEECGKKFKKKYSYNIHLKNYETYQSCHIRKCIVCKEMVPKDQYSTHVETHRTFKCGKCKMKCLSAKALNRHYMVHQKPVVKKKSTKTELCTICGKLIVGSNINHHMQSHLTTRNHLCDKCPKSFKHHSCLRKHIKIVHNTIRCYECPICKRKTKTRESMKDHMRLKHTNTYTFTCYLCGSGFNREDYFKRHLNQHSIRDSEGRILNRPSTGRNIYIKRNENDPFYTCKYCHREYKTVHKLRVHLLSSHLNRTRLKCRYCDMTFKSVVIRLRHEKRHANPELYALTCQICWNRFSSKEKLEAHSVVHLGSERRRCDICGAAFPSKFLLNHHKGEMHFSEEQLEKQRNMLLQDGLRDYKIRRESSSDE